MTDAYIYDAVRTPRGRGKPDGSLHEVTPIQLATQVLQAVRDRSELDTAEIDDVIFGVCSANARQLEATLSGLLVRAQQAGDIPADRAVIPLARFLMSTINGLAVTAKATRDPKVLNDVVEVALSALDL